MQKKEYKKNTDQVTDLLGIIPPQAIDLEEAVLGAMIIDSEAVNIAFEILKPESFYSQINKIIFEAIVAIYKQMMPVDILLVKEELSRRRQLDEIGGALYLTKLTGRVASAAHVEFHSRIIAQKYIQRELIRVATEIQKKSYDDQEDIADLLDFSQNELFQLSDGSIKREAQHIGDVLLLAIDQIKKAGESPEGLSGVPSSFSDLDRVTSGWQKSDLIIVAARPSMGKTAFVISMARNIAIDHNRSVGIFTLEMSSVQVINRLIVAETEINSEDIRNGRLSPEQWGILDQRIKKLENAKIFIDDTPALGIYELRSKARRLVEQSNVEIIIIDYLQLMSSSLKDAKYNREQEVSNISRSLKALAKELNIPIIALSQLNRSVESRAGSKRPQLSDLRESGAIEQDADIVMFIHRPEYYGDPIRVVKDDQGNDKDEDTKGLANIIIAKHRSGAIRDIDLRFDARFARFSDWNKF